MSQVFNLLVAVEATHVEGPALTDSAEVAERVASMISGHPYATVHSSERGFSVYALDWTSIVERDETAGKGEDLMLLIQRYATRCTQARTAPEDSPSRAELSSDAGVIYAELERRIRAMQARSA